MTGTLNAIPTEEGVVTAAVTTKVDEDKGKETPLLLMLKPDTDAAAKKMMTVEKPRETEKDKKICRGVVSFKEETYMAGELAEEQTKALEELKEIVRAAVKKKRWLMWRWRRKRRWKLRWKRPWRT